MNYFIQKQLPLLPPSSFTREETAFVGKRIKSICCNAVDLNDFAASIDGVREPLPLLGNQAFNIKAELEAFYAKKYGLSRGDLSYILEPKSVLGEDYPSETFRVLKTNEIRELGEYRTQRLVLEAWDRLFGPAS